MVEFFCSFRHVLLLFSENTGLSILTRDKYTFSFSFGGQDCCIHHFQQSCSVSKSLRASKLLVRTWQALETHRFSSVVQPSFGLFCELVDAMRKRKAGDDSARQASKSFIVKLRREFSRIQPSVSQQCFCCRRWSGFILTTCACARNASTRPLPPRKAAAKPSASVTHVLRGIRSFPVLYPSLDTPPRVLQLHKVTILSDLRLESSPAHHHLKKIILPAFNSSPVPCAVSSSSTNQQRREEVDLLFPHEVFYSSFTTAKDYVFPFYLRRNVIDFICL